MSRILVLGGTAWLGGRIAEAALAAGHEVTCLARGEEVPAGARLVRADRDDEDALAAVASEHWDAVIDIGRHPGHVRRAVRDLEPVAERYVLVSSGNVYASQAEPGADEDAELLPPLAADRIVDPETDYGPAKVAAEQVVLAGFGPERASLVRSGLIGGPGDPGGRTGYWPLRFARPSNPEGRVLVPDVPALPMAIIDVRDLAAWCVRLATDGPGGAFNATGEPIPLAAQIEAARIVAGGAATAVPVPREWLIEQGVAEWSGPRSLPLWIADPEWYGMNARSTERARAAGLVCRPLTETLADSLAFELVRPGPVARGAGLTDEEERALLEVWDARAAE